MGGKDVERNSGGIYMVVSWHWYLGTEKNQRNLSLSVHVQALI
jgi:hypothetical protein